MEDLQRENEWCMKKNQQLSLRMSECTEEHASLTVEKESLEKRLKQMTFNYKASVGFAEEHEDNISKLELQIHSLSRDLLKANAKITTYIKEEELQAARIEEFYKENQELKVKLTALENGSVKKSSFEVLLLKYNDLQNEMDCLCCERDVLVLVYWVEWAAT
jgi:chromosome segregation ATPase